MEHLGMNGASTTLQPGSPTRFPGTPPGLPAALRGRRGPWLLLAAVLAWAPDAFAQVEAASATWRRDVEAARKEAVRDGRPCVLLVRGDAPAH